MFQTLLYGAEQEIELLDDIDENIREEAKRKVDKLHGARAAGNGRVLSSAPPTQAANRLGAACSLRRAPRRNPATGRALGYRGVQPRERLDALASGPQLEG